MVRILSIHILGRKTRSRLINKIFNWVEQPLVVYNSIYFPGKKFCEKYIQLGTLNRGSATFISLRKPFPSTTDIGSNWNYEVTNSTNYLCRVEAVPSGVTLQKPSKMEAWHPSFEGAWPSLLRLCSCWCSFLWWRSRCKNRLDVLFL